jgi:hypothetical protein
LAHRLASQHALPGFVNDIGAATYFGSEFKTDSFQHQVVVPA